MPIDPEFVQRQRGRGQRVPGENLPVLLLIPVEPARPALLMGPIMRGEAGGAVGKAARHVRACAGDNTRIVVPGALASAAGVSAQREQNLEPSARLCAQRGGLVIARAEPKERRAPIARPWAGESRQPSGRLGQRLQPPPPARQDRSGQRGKSVRIACGGTLPSAPENWTLQPSATWPSDPNWSAFTPKSFCHRPNTGWPARSKRGGGPDQITLPPLPANLLQEVQQLRRRQRLEQHGQRAELAPGHFDAAHPLPRARAGAASAA